MEANDNSSLCNNDSNYTQSESKTNTPTTVVEDIIPTPIENGCFENFNVSPSNGIFEYNNNNHEKMVVYHQIEKSGKHDNKTRWTKEEDRYLKGLIGENQVKRWESIAMRMNEKSRKQCRDRWCNHLKPDIKKDPWMEEEERILVEAHKKCGNKWAYIAKLIPGRTENSVKNLWHGTKKSLKLQIHTTKKPNSNKSTILKEYQKTLFTKATPNASTFPTTTTTTTTTPNAITFPITTTTILPINIDSHALTKPITSTNNVFSPLITSFEEEPFFMQPFPMYSYDGNPICFDTNYNHIEQQHDSIIMDGGSNPFTLTMPEFGNNSNSSHMSINNNGAAYGGEARFDYNNFPWNLEHESASFLQDMPMSNELCNKNSHLDNEQLPEFGNNSNASHMSVNNGVYEGEASFDYGNFPWNLEHESATFLQDMPLSTELWSKNHHLDNEQLQSVDVEEKKSFSNDDDKTIDDMDLCEMIEKYM